MLWNIRLIPVLLLILFANLIFFGIGFLVTETAFAEYSYSYVDGDGLPLLYFFSVFIGILIFIGWMIFYMRNNAFRIHYPRKVIFLYAEWCLCFLICAGISVLPVSLTNGCRLKWQGVMSEKSATEALNVIYMASILIPSSPDEYVFNEYNDDPIPIPTGMHIRLDSVDSDDYSIEYGSHGQFHIKGYKGSSLLFYNGGYDYDYDKYGRKFSKKNENVVRVLSWLKNQNQDSIYSLMKDYLALAKKQNIYVDLNAEQWMDRIYNPPFYPVNSKTLLRNSDSNYSSYYYKGQYFDYEFNTPIMQNSRLENGFDNILKSHQNNEIIRFVTLTCMCVALGISFAVFSCRVTSGKKWLRAFITVGVLMFLIGLISALFAMNISYHSGSIFISISTSFWLTVFVAIGIYLIKKIIEKGNKGNTNILMNIFLWLTPCFIPLCYVLLFSYFEYFGWDSDLEKEWVVESVFWGNIVIVTLAMIPITIFVKKWKGLPDE